MSSVPTIDLRHLNTVALASLDAACRDHGFFRLKGHGLDDLMDDMWHVSAAFFEEPLEAKNAVRRTAVNPLGYYDRELTKRKRDQKEVFDFRINDWQKGDRAMPWPNDMPAFEAALRAYFAACIQLSENVLELICQAMGAAPDSLSHHFGQRHTSTARINHYPAYDPLPEEDRGTVNELGDMALHHHTDPGALTLLFQDNVGGLQAKSKEDGWIDVPADGNAIVVNLGDIMQVWTNDRYKAAMHRVTQRTDQRSRYSIPFFYQPVADASIAPLDDTSPPHYRPFSWRDFIQARVDDNYADLGADDTQVDHFRITT
jgi:isopenicillin N synthase-like dioxygenase